MEGTDIMVTPARVILFLVGLLVGGFFAALVASGGLGLNWLTLFAVVVVIIFTLKLLSQPDNAWTLAGVAVGVILALLVAALSPVLLGVPTLVILLVYLVVK